MGGQVLRHETVAVVGVVVLVEGAQDDGESWRQRTCS